MREKLSYSKRRRGGNVGKCVKLREEANASAMSFSVCLHRHIKRDKLGSTFFMAYHISAKNFLKNPVSILFLMSKLFLQLTILSA